MCRYGLGLFGFGQTGSETMANMRSIFSQVYFVGLAHEGDTKNQALWGLGVSRGAVQRMRSGITCQILVMSMLAVKSMRQAARTGLTERFHASGDEPMLKGVAIKRSNTICTPACWRSYQWWKRFIEVPFRSE
ncbi:MAG: hypothetical protein A3C93_02105 [Candidatus Lloydbacteria bacterium RIFCSPHIGHO2_02_FULL_54_17]|uniref:Uncharacterized protein n=1 Tax=Candidatus Lloydbacteria bacterium RIFCSPHIGHO2_02_FULL_54_17 TaxID=1798664 RepID=A0A1G2DHX4_9BACT|nr:MAG: hypothetical protein A2762_05655 [Candidatus Lloydbacteria bacterium RIFCSPHIGHO2_01_FULL_54_11]OGZ13245.1 MAG: hypothetical protein A3C93_02105 [Candidatus Lloydbacteria bacterium RIFCSPHIGHO2_02_FULL_54_17]OGZ15375.1 MAG: hypothetical protein A2948_00120 [Candidatus Lloydbacteria bacterium RIFCSPLOWO2_01_FULL_54_18]OGZ15806.1 MAG: hypothetical protein A3H76_05790 [Candidatus Lloydbacteria bacterium RIFCSPLOWO2_02_FULL_54_12]